MEWYGNVVLLTKEEENKTLFWITSAFHPEEYECPEGWKVYEIDEDVNYIREIICGLCDGILPLGTQIITTDNIDPIISNLSDQLTPPIEMSNMVVLPYSIHTKIALHAAA